ncbi:MAG: transcription antitermination protein NusB [bacterium]
MISRRLLRIKVLHVLYAYFKSTDKSINQSEKELNFSIKKVYDLYHYLLLLMIDIRKFAEKQVEIAKNKRIPSEEDIHPNTTFIDNKVLKLLEESQGFQQYINEKKMSWVQHPGLIKKLFEEIKHSEEYTNYMKKDRVLLNDDKQILVDIFTNIILLNEDLEQTLEEQSIFWNDDIDFVIGMIVKTLKNVKNEDNQEDIKLFPLFKNDDDREFVKTLFRKSILKFQENNKLIDNHTKNWEIERIAFIDILLLNLAITEIAEFSSIPTRVSFNEYIEISKFYSTEKSSVFINGVLDKVIKEMKERNLIIKHGRGLIGES